MESKTDSLAKVKHVPRVGAPARGTQTGRPLMVALDLMGRRSMLRILWELRDGPLTFRMLQEGCETNSRLLNTRLKELREAGLVVHEGVGYQVTPLGRKLQRALQPLLTWSKEWGEEMAGGGWVEPDGASAAGEMGD